MFRTRWTTVLACLIAPAVVPWAGADLSLPLPGCVPALPPWAAVLARAPTCCLFIAGLAVRRLRAHEPTWITPTGAATTAVAAQASAIVGALVGGVYAGEIARRNSTTSPARTTTAKQRGADRAPPGARNSRTA